MRFICQRCVNSCGVDVVMFIIKNYTKMSFLNIKTTKNIPISTITVLLSEYLVENKLYFCSKIEGYIHINFPTIIHIKRLIHYHYVILLGKYNEYYLVYDPSAFGFVYIPIKRINSKWSGYFIEIYNVSSNRLKNTFYISYPLKIILIEIAVLFLIYMVFYFIEK